jgi:hypothetical protein
MSSKSVKSGVSPRNTKLQTCSQSDSWWMFCTDSFFDCAGHTCFVLLSSIAVLSQFWLTIQKNLFSIKPVQTLNLNRRSSSGLQPEWPITLHGSPFQQLNQWYDFDQTWYEHCAIERYAAAKLWCKSDTRCTYWRILNWCVTIYVTSVKDILKCKITKWWLMQKFSAAFDLLEINCVATRLLCNHYDVYT